MNNSTFVGIVARSAGNSRAIHFAKAVTALLFLVFIVQFNALAQGPPSCNLSGPLAAKAKGSTITVNIEVANSTANPNLTYTLLKNVSGAVIVSKGRVNYNSSTNSVTQQITIDPGKTVGGFNLELSAKTPSGTSKCSKSVSVTN